MGKHNTEIVTNNGNVNAYFETALEAYRKLPWYKRLIGETFFSYRVVNGRHIVTFNS